MYIHVSIEFLLIEKYISILFYSILFVNCQKDIQIIVFMQLAQRFYHTIGLILLKLCQSVAINQFLLSIYQHVGSSEKISMGKAIGEHLNNKQTT